MNESGKTEPATSFAVDLEIAPDILPKKLENPDQSNNDRLEFLLEATRQLLGSPELKTVLPALLDIARQVVKADAYAVWRHLEATNEWVTLASSGLPSDFLQTSARTPGRDEPFDKPLVAPDVEHAPELQSRLASYHRAAIRALLVIPLVIHGKTAGSVAFYYRQPHKFTPPEIRTASTLASLAGAAIGTAELYEEQTRLRQAAQLAHSRLAFLAEAGATLASSLDYQTTLQSVAQLAVPYLADWCSVYMIAAQPDTGQVILEQVAVAHVDPVKVELARELRKRYPLDPTDLEGIASVIYNGQPVIMPQISWQEVAKKLKNAEEISFVRDLGFTSLISAPMISREQTIGVLLFANSDSGRQFNQDDLALATELARRAANAIDNARLFQQEQHSRLEAENTRQILTFLAQAGEILTSSLDYNETLAHLTRLSIPTLADYTVLDMLNEKGELERLALAHIDPEKERLMYEVQRLYPPDPGSPIGIPKALRTRQTELVNNINPADLRIYSRNEEHFQALLALAPSAGVSIPLIGRNNQPLGVLSFAFTHPQRQYTAEIIKVAEELARRAAIAVDNALLYQQATRAIALRDDFLSVAAHELKTPITSLKGYSQLIIRQLERTGVIDPERVRRALNVIDEQSDKLAVLVSQLLDVTRLEAGKVCLTRQPTNLLVLAQAVVATTRLTLLSVAQPCNFLVRLQPELSTGEAVVVNVDSLRFEQILINLVNNALKFSPADGLITIEVGLNRSGLKPHAWLSVEDQGSGIAEEDRERIFERFYQAKPGISSGGMGLGLYISRELVLLHGGSIWVESPETGGTRFVVTVPLEVD